MKIRSGFVSNSSSSSFICGSYDRNKKFTVDEVTSKLEALLRMHNELMGTELEFDDVFAPVYVAPKGGVHEGWEAHYPHLKECGGKVVIDSADDNSIPCPMFDYISTMFDARYTHRG